MNTMTVSTAIYSGRVQLVTARQQHLSVARARVLFVAALFAALALAAVVRIVYLGLTDAAHSATSFEEALLPPRGEITDRNGETLARAFPAFALWFNPDALGGGSSLVASSKAVAAELKAIFPDIDEAQIADRLAKGKAGYLRRRVLPEEANRVQALGELGLELPQETDRHYPQGSMAAHVLGYVAADGHGRVGMESVLDKQLADPATRGTSIPLSIDVRVQGALEDELTRGMRATNAVGSAGIVLDVDTGEVLALASLPEFDPNRIDEAGAANMFNRVTNQVYELGSTFKPLTVAAGIDAGTITDFGRRYSARPFPIGGFTIRDSHPLGDSLNTPEMLMHSSNVVTAHMVRELGANRLKKVMADLGMNERPYIELPAKGFPIWASGDWPLLRGMTVGYGHGIAVTPLHLASSYAAMVNGGIWRPATLHKLAPGQAPKGRRVFKASTSSRMNQLLRMIVVYGTGRKADAPGFRIGGKTGSAEKPGAGGYRKTSLVSTFAAAFPMDRPRYVVIAMLDEPKGTVASSFQRTAAWNAAPIVGRLVPRIGPMLGIAPDAQRDVDLSDLAPLVPQSAKE
ncbi:penicillin-binding protein 2 [Altererythrobacter aerius]|uniref:Penicillin-binding protein 2 n=1 Tax=Tsuneonella aeria TaxID=1837929 RepID=A0A6I4TAP1_9SPHN|nr:penicillin-binding protein 2 [Tsuneonella aeria]MXO74589.1 penicillin-binding protein 2 [Tsuneonella aeria]